MIFISSRALVDNYSKEELEKLIYIKSFVEIGKKYNVTDNAVRKWCKSYGLPFRYGELHKYGA